MISVIMSTVVTIFRSRDFWQSFQNYLFSNTIFYSLTYILPRVPPGILGDIYTTLIQHNKSSYYSDLFFEVFPTENELSLRRFLFNWFGFIFNGNKARTTLIFVDLTNGKIKLFNHLFFYLFKFIKTTILIFLMFGVRLYGKEIVPGIEWTDSLRVACFVSG